ncbi:hypothetical protein GCM10011491_12010 [Brucella endophytica]|uniref:Uncharacterized protein n=1 Tax=Brucella endophytica TaxID=1963359 RepID=A0A916S623_9HYPH|nr:hypothetical protein [Brucella endophytica]GGA86019.1 hypothetical protein GCM10011491_12010 [Brucella endophytica]
MSKLIERPRLVAAMALQCGLSAGEATTDTIAYVKISHVILPLKTAISDAKVLTGRQKPMTEPLLDRRAARRL